jgi:hypothetical protein
MEILSLLKWLLFSKSSKVTSLGILQFVKLQILPERILKRKSEMSKIAKTLTNV